MINEKLLKLDWVIDFAMENRGTDMEPKVVREVISPRYGSQTLQINVFS